MLPWWRARGDRFEYELTQLRNAGIEWTVVIQDERTGDLELELQAIIRGKKEKFLARFPPFYPYTRFEVYAPDWQLARHQHPYSKNLCLIGRASINWDIDDTLAAFIVDRVPLLLDVVAEDDVDRLVGYEEPQGEPVSAYLNPEPNSLVLIDSDWVLDPAVTHGELVIGLEEILDNAIRGSVLEVRDTTGRVLASADQRMRRRFASQVCRGRWYRLDREIRRESAKGFLDELAILAPGSSATRWNIFGQAKFDVVAAVFPEELTWRKQGDGWIFVIRKARPRQGFRDGRYWEAYYARTGRAGVSDIAFRAPELRFMQTRTIALVGLGCLGAAIAMEFARAGAGTLRVMDADVIEPATTMRWPLGFAAAGRSKAKVVLDFISYQYPYTVVEGVEARFGPETSMCGVDLSKAEQFLDGADILVDATAETGIHYLLAQLARERGMPYLMVSASPGAWGGTVARFVPSRTGACWSCYLRAIEDRHIPVPPEDPNGLHQPPGCAAPTFTGASFDLLQIAMMGVRLAVSTLSNEQGYPQFEFDGCVVHLRTELGSAVVPQSQTFSIPIHPQCTNHVT